MSRKYSIGIDIGSTASKVCILGLGEKPVYQVLPTGWNSKITAGIIKDHLEETIGDLSNAGIVATGYGRISVNYADKVVTEITCHGRGGYSLIGRDCSIVDVGGQDTKFINVKNGKPVDFLMNDKCAAGTGKFIEVMANRLGLTIEELFEEAQKGEAIPISSICTVFAESEVVSLIAENAETGDIIHALNKSVASRTASMVRRVKGRAPFMMTGGVARNEGVVKELEKTLGARVFVGAYPDLAGAFGAALFAKEKA